MLSDCRAFLFCLRYMITIFRRSFHSFSFGFIFELPQKSFTLNCKTTFLFLKIVIDDNCLSVDHKNKGSIGGMDTVCFDTSMYANVNKDVYCNQSCPDYLLRKVINS